MPMLHQNREQRPAPTKRDRAARRRVTTLAMHLAGHTIDDENTKSYEETSTAPSDGLATWENEALAGTHLDFMREYLEPMLEQTIVDKQADENLQRAMAGPLNPSHFLQLFMRTTKEAITHWTPGVVDISDLSHNLVLSNILVVLCGDLAAEAYECLGAFQVTEAMMQRLCDKVETTEQMKHTLQAAASRVVQAFRARVEGTARVRRGVSQSILYKQMQAGHTDTEMAATVFDLMFAAGEVPATALAQTLNKLCENSEAQQRLHAEVRLVCGQSSQLSNLLVGYEDLVQTEACIAEGLQLCEGEQLQGRLGGKDVTLAMCKVSLAMVLERFELCSVAVPVTSNSSTHAVLCLR